MTLKGAPYVGRSGIPRFSGVFRQLGRRFRLKTLHYIFFNGSRISKFNGRKVGQLDKKFQAIENQKKITNRKIELPHLIQYLNKQLSSIISEIRNFYDSANFGLKSI